MFSIKGLFIVITDFLLTINKLFICIAFINVVSFGLV